ncbi:hypothetical protein KIN20_018146 [Parelaphostrongylus tenuis]|uniref:Uncharacterized protein n=1 Tax=Parelaphostrongylus tenuis TaxID=148309 RepID=A0AAD5N0R2_PARTN|nr:hypothetical protein KIN20_018146 [Parelaphostrongylus tenuis]
MGDVAGTMKTNDETKMKFAMKIVRYSTNLFLILPLTMTPAVWGCGVMPLGQANSRMFKVMGFTTLPPNMVYAATTDVSAQVPGMASSKDGAQAFVSRLVMQTSPPWRTNCVVVDNSVTGVCLKMGNMECGMTIMPISTNHTSIPRTSSWRFGRHPCGKM